MADILIRGLSIPKEGFINLSVQSEGLTMLTATSTFNEKTGWFEWQKCDHTMHETIELPEHGDLIDRDALLAEYERDERAADEHGREFSFSFDSGGARCTEWWIVQQKLMDAHAIVPSNKEESE